MTYISWASDFAFICDRIKYECIIFWIFVQSESVNDVILFAGHCDLFSWSNGLPCISDLILKKDVIGH